MEATSKSLARNTIHIGCFDANSVLFTLERNYNLQGDLIAVLAQTCALMEEFVVVDPRLG